MIRKSLLSLLITLLFIPAKAKQTDQDAKIKGHVLTTLYFDQIVLEPQKMVDVKQGVVIIDTTLTNPGTLFRIEQAVKNIEGVKRIQFHSTSKS